MCGICFVCTLSRNSQENKYNKSGSKSSSLITDNKSDPTLLTTGARCLQTLLPDLVDYTDNIHLSDIPVSASERRQHDNFVDTLFMDALLRHRGPDVSSKHAFTLSEGLDGFMQGCVLHLRGKITPQPVKDAMGNALLWNGEIFDGIQLQEHDNDTQVLFCHLASSHSEEDVLKTMQKVHGPWAFIFWQADKQKLWFGRDMFGRRSLLWHLPLSCSDHLILSSVAIGGQNYSEIPSVGIFCLDFSKVMISGGTALPLLTLHPWNCCRWPGTSVTVIGTEEADMLKYLYPNLSTCLSVSVDDREILDTWIPDINKHLPDTDQFSWLSDFDMNYASLEDILVQILKTRSDLDKLADQMITVLQQSVNKRVNNLCRESNIFQDSFHIFDREPDIYSPVTACQEDESQGLECDVNKLSNGESRNLASGAHVAVLFSGGLDSTILAALADRCVPEGEPIDLLNVAFKQPVKKTLFKKKPKECQKKMKKNSERMHNIAVSESKKSESRPAHLCTTPCDVSGDGECFQERGVLYDASESHLKKEHVLNGSNVTHQASLFDAGYPNTSLNSHLYGKPSMNNEFNSSNLENVYEDIPSQVNSSDSFDVPDRQTGRIALAELNPKRKWNFVEINVEQAELQDIRKSHIHKLIYPLQTVLDDSIGCAVWFAARGSGVLPQDNYQKFTSTARVILCGMAADEQFAGYSRHRVTFKTKGWEELLKELQEEMWRISARNLGRDDRIMTDHGKECRFPFLDEAFTEFVSSIPIYQRADLRLPRGVGDKLLLRLCALKLGLVKTAVQPKRAIQFGSKIAKLDQRKEKGSDVCDRLHLSF